MDLLMEYSIRITPGLIVLGTIYLLLPKKEKLFKIFLLILGFILMRDAMTPIGLWEFGLNENVMWLRFIDSPFILITLALTCLTISLLFYFYGMEREKDFSWYSNSLIISILVGILLSALAVIPFMLPYFSTPLSDRGGEVATNLILPLLIFALLGNFLEELLFRGYMQNYLKAQGIGTFKRVFLSGLLFAMGHIFLALTVTDLGIMILLFTFWEGLLCAAAYEKYGLLAATVTHGMSIFILASGLI